VALLGSIVVPAAAQATPVRTGVGTGPGFSVILCKASDRAVEPQQPAFFAGMLLDRGFNGVADYLWDQSFRRFTTYTSSGSSAVRGWYTTTWTQSALQGLMGPSYRARKIQICVDAAQAAGYTPPAGNRIVAVYNVDVGDAGAAGWGVLLPPGAYNTGFAAHEMLHTLGLGHSYSNDTTFRSASWANPGEYDDPWDEMSAMNIYSPPGYPYQRAPVGLNGFHRDKLGWLPRNRVVTFGAGGPASGTVTLAPLHNADPALSRPVLVRVPITASDPTHYYTIEYRKKTGWDYGIPADIVLIHEIRGNTSYLIRQLSTADRAPAQVVNTAQVRISVGTVSGDTASVWIATTSAAVGLYGPNTCTTGYVWREADIFDYVCVTPATRDQVRADNQADPGRHQPGSIYCLSGYVWRGAFASDYVCVTPSTRNQTWDDNNHAAERVAQP
jgi:hypothetical protein